MDFVEQAHEKKSYRDNSKCKHYQLSQVKDFNVFTVILSWIISLATTWEESMTTPQITLSKFTVFFDKLFITFSILRKCAVKSKTYSPLLRRSLKTIPPNAPFGPPLSPLPLPVLSYFNQVSSWQSSQLFSLPTVLQFCQKDFQPTKQYKRLNLMPLYDKNTRRQMKAQCHNYRISPIVSITFLLLSQLYFPKCINCISPTVPIVFLKICKLYFSYWSCDSGGLAMIRWWQSCTHHQLRAFPSDNQS